MDANTIAYLITNVGFAIVVSLICMWYIKKQNEDARQERRELLEDAKQERQELNSQIGNKIDTLTNLICALSVEPDKIKKRSIEEYED